MTKLKAFGRIALDSLSLKGVPESLIRRRQAKHGAQPFEVYFLEKDGSYGRRVVATDHGTVAANTLLSIVGRGHRKAVLVVNEDRS